MSSAPRNDERELQDYLDGRLPTERRAELESRLARSPELRRELASALEIREALGAANEELSPGFYTRARARFEQSAGQTGSRWSFRLLSWETAGVAAAAALATALFVPWLTDEGVPQDLGSARIIEVEEPGIREEIATPVDDLDVSRSRLEQTQEAGDLEESVGGRLEAQMEDSAPEPQPVEQERVRRRVVTKEKAENAPREDAGKGYEGESRALEENKKRAAVAAGEQAPQRGSRDDSSALAERENEVLQPTAPGVATEGMVKQSAVAKTDAAATYRDAPVAEKPLVSVELPAGLVAAGELLTVEDVDEWAALLDGPHGRALSMLGPPAPDRRLVLVGAREDLSCDALRISRAGETYGLEMIAARTGTRTAPGCAFTLPRDQRPITVIQVEGDQR